MDTAELSSATIELLEYDVAWHAANQTWNWLTTTKDLPDCPWASTKPNSAGHAILTSALAYYYLIEKRPDLAKWGGSVRLAALCHTQINQLNNFRLEPQEYTVTAWLLSQLTRSELPKAPPPFLALDEITILKQAMQVAHQGAGAELVEQPSEEIFAQPAYRELAAASVGLVYGGATKIKEYVFESSVLPEIRGASALLDYINLQLIPSLFNQTITGGTETQKRIAAYNYAEGLNLVPEGLIYANGGEFLAFTPASQALQLAEKIEQIYAQETLTAQAIAVGETFSLLELRYGLRPEKYSVQAYQKDVAATNIAVKTAFRPINGQRGIESYWQTKNFSEIVGYLAQLRYRRREFNSLITRQGQLVAPRQLAQFDTFPLGRRCDSCDRRVAVVERPPSDDEPILRKLCEPCARKAFVGQRLRNKIRRKADEEHWFISEGFHWQLPPEMSNWQTKFNDYLENYLKSHPALEPSYPTAPGDIRLARDLEEIGQGRMKTLDQNGRESNFSAGTVSGYIGLIYGDGNNMGGLLQKIKSPGEYQYFAQKVFEVLQEAVNTTLVEKLRPARDDKNNWYHPFEILSVGGDDLYLIVPASAALEVATAIAERVEVTLSADPNFLHQPVAGEPIYEPQQVHRYSLPEGEVSGHKPHGPGNVNANNLRGQSEVSLSVGVLLAPATTPVFFLDELVGQLLKSAKKKAGELRRYAGYWGGTLDFMALKSVTMVSTKLGEWRNLTQEINGHFHNLRLTARPYTTWEMTMLLRTLEILKLPDGPPRSQLYQLQDQLRLGERAGEVTYRYHLNRFASTSLKNEMQRWLGKNKDSPWRPGTSFKPQKTTGKQVSAWLETVLPDLIELYDFVAERP